MAQPIKSVYATWRAKLLPTVENNVKIRYHVHKIPWMAAERNIYVSIWSYVSRVAESV
jgi:hypothetical protein